MMTSFAEAIITEVSLFFRCFLCFSEINQGFSFTICSFSSSRMSTSTPSSSGATQRPPAGWTVDETNKMDKYIIKEAAGVVISPEKWENAFRRHSVASTKAKRRHRMSELQKSGKLPPPPPPPLSLPTSKASSKKKERTPTQVNRDLFNAVFSGLGGASSSSSKPSEQSYGKFFLSLMIC